MSVNPHTQDPNIPPTLKDDGFELLASPDPDDDKVRAVFCPDDKWTDGPWYVDCDTNTSHGDAADVFYLSRLLQIVATQVVWLNSGMQREQVEKWGAEAVASAKRQLELDENLQALTAQVETALTLDK